MSPIGLPTMVEGDNVEGAVVEGDWLGWPLPLVGPQVGASVALGAKLWLGTRLGASLVAIVGAFVTLGEKLWLGRTVGLRLDPVAGEWETLG